MCIYSIYYNFNCIYIFTKYLNIVYIRDLLNIYR